MKLTLYYIYFITTALPTLVVLTVITSVFTIIGAACGSPRILTYYPAKMWARAFALLSLVRVSVRGRRHIKADSSYVFVANHQGAYDIFAIYGYLNHSFNWMMKKSLEKIPFVGRACRAAGHILVDRSSPAAIRDTIHTAEQRLSGGMSLVVFPEGARTHNGHMSRFKKGAFYLAMEFGRPIVPITIDGSFTVMPRSARLPRPGHIILTIHQPIEPPADDADKDRISRIAYEAIESSLPERDRNTTDNNQHQHNG